eukprot:Nitzschia sp. Nitz4//scaffold276_size25055//13435//14094//NITZ4_008342-RA/size25055-processed-gene-0.12-mRNA-1//1//CDS//3329545328//3139//frame0
MKQSLVRFCDDEPVVHEVDRVRRADRSLVWWTEVDYVRIHATNTFIVQKDIDKEAECEFYCQRGLEAWGSKRSTSRREIVNGAVEVVLDLQRKMLDGDKSINASEIASAYSMHTTNSQVQARVRGLSDEQAAFLASAYKEDVFHEDDTTTTEEESEDFSCHSGIDSAAPVETQESSGSQLNFLKKRRFSDKRRSLVMNSLKKFARRVTSQQPTAIMAHQ